MLRRVLAFVILGPFLAYLVFRLVMAKFPLAPLGSEELVLLLVAYLGGFVPALVMAGIDQMLADRRLLLRPIWTGICATGIASFLVALWIVSVGRWTSEAFFWILPIGISALACSLLSGARSRQPIAAADPAR